MRIDTYRRNNKIKTIAFLFSSCLRRVNARILLKQEPFDGDKKRFRYLLLYSMNQYENVRMYLTTRIAKRKYEELHNHGGWIRHGNKK